MLSRSEDTADCAHSAVSFAQPGRKGGVTGRADRVRGVAVYSSDLELALRLADAADAITRARFGALDLKVDAKPDLTPVSDADLAVERAIRQVLSEARPDDAVLGE